MASYADKGQNASKGSKKFSSVGEGELKKWDSISKNGVKVTQIRAEQSRVKQEFLKKDGKKEQLMDFIFGKTEENPLDEINSEFESKLDKTKETVSNTAIL
jgi:hypothetical protein